MRKKKLLPILLALAMVISLLPTTAMAVRIGDKDKTAITVNTTKVAFAGQTWWVIGNDQSGVYPQEDHITLLAANAVKDYRNVAFRNMVNEPDEGFKQYRKYNMYFADNPDYLANWTTPNEYAGSTLQQKLEMVANGFPEKEQSLITARDLTEKDGITGQGIADQKLWALSDTEWDDIDNKNVQEYNSNWWLRTPEEDNGMALGDAKILNGTSGGFKEGGMFVYNRIHARPALSLDLSKVLFASTANANAGKSTATVGSGLTTAQAVAGRIKFTVVDEEQTLALTVKEGQSLKKVNELKFDYSNATPGENQYVSCVLINKNGVVKYYGKLADSSGAANGEISIPLEDVANGTYTLKIFSEQANGDLYTDFCSEPVTYTLAVTNGKGTLHVHNWGEATYTWSDDGTTCTASRTCTGEPNHNQNSAATVKGEQTKAPTCTEKGETTYTATFTAVWAEDQTKTVADIKALGHELIKTEAKEATCTKDGNIAYWTCETCGRYFSDEAGTKEITLNDTVIPELGHSYKDGVCTVCGEADPGYTGDESAQTGDDSNMMMFAALAAMAAAAAAAAGIYGRRKKQR